MKLTQARLRSLIQTVLKEGPGENPASYNSASAIDRSEPGVDVKVFGFISDAIAEIRASGFNGNSSGAYVLKTLERAMKAGGQDPKPYINDAMQELQAGGTGVTDPGRYVLKLLRQALAMLPKTSATTSATLMPESITEALSRRARNSST